MVTVAASIIVTIGKKADFPNPNFQPGQTTMAFRWESGVNVRFADLSIGLDVRLFDVRKFTRLSL